MSFRGQRSLNRQRHAADRSGTDAASPALAGRGV